MHPQNKDWSSQANEGLLLSCLGPTGEDGHESEIAPVRIRGRGYLRDFPLPVLLGGPEIPARTCRRNGGRRTEGPTEPHLP